MAKNNLFEMFIKDEAENMSTIFLNIGINGLLLRFENWLYQWNLVDKYEVKKFEESSIPNISQK